MAAPGVLTIKRAYDEPAAGDGYRVLVDRLWPRGLTKERAALDLWLKEAAPSPDLRTWFGHDPARFSEFSRRYRDELQENPAAEQLCGLLAEHRNVTLVYAAKDPEHNHALVLQHHLQAVCKNT